MATTTTTIATPDPAICEYGGSGMFVPLFSSDEGNWDKGPRAVLYGIFMCYCFLGASIVSDYFMTAIEAITSKKARRKDEKNGRTTTYYVWNDTVANLTLMALGSSAPEILLSILEVLKLDFIAGDLGPGTIVGSAAFNTLCIISVAICAIPKGEVRYVKGVGVYHVTVVFATFAYLWLLFIVQINTKDVVEVWESVTTLIMFFILVVLAYVVDKRETKRELEEDKAVRKVELEIAMDRMETIKSIHPETTPEIIDECLEDVHAPKLKLRKILNVHMKMVKVHNKIIHDKAETKMTASISQAMVGGGRKSCGPSVHLPTKALSQSIADILQRCPPSGDDGTQIMVKDESGDVGTSPLKNRHGVLTFLTDNIEVKGCLNETVFRIPVLRRNGLAGDVSVRWRLSRLGAIPGCDYVDGEGEMRFADGVSFEELELTVLPQRPSERSEAFQLILDEPDGGCEFNPHDDGKENMAILTITIVNAAEGGSCYEAMVDPELLQYGYKLWREQIADAFEKNHTGDPPTVPENVMFYLSFPWKILFGFFAPPPVFLGGWVLFFSALAFIGILTALVADLAETFGCCCGFENTVTAIIVVAPGTSLPDLFASQAAAKADEHADASIVNVTGSNSVNVFLGIGLPWTIAAVYWAAKKEVGANAAYLSKYPNIVNEYPNGAFIVEAGSLSFSVITFSSVSIICLGCLRIKRHINGGELGGTSFINKEAPAIFFTFLWIWYLIWNILKSSTDDADIGQWISIGLCGIFVVAVIAMELAVNSGAMSSKSPSAKPPVAASENDKTPLVDSDDSPEVEAAPLDDVFVSDDSAQKTSLDDVKEQADPVLAVIVGNAQDEVQADMPAAENNSDGSGSKGTKSQASGSSVAKKKAKSGEGSTSPKAFPKGKAGAKPKSVAKTGSPK